MKTNNKKMNYMKEMLRTFILIPSMIAILAGVLIGMFSNIIDHGHDPIMQTCDIKYVSNNKVVLTCEHNIWD